MTKMFKESIHQEFESFRRDEMDNIERKKYLASKRYKNMIKRFSEILLENSLQNNSK